MSNPALPAARRSNYRRVAVKIALYTLIITTVTGSVLAYNVWEHPSQGQMLLAQYSTLHYTAPADQIVYRYNPADTAKQALEAQSIDDHDEPATGKNLLGHPVECDIIASHLIPAGGVGDPLALATLNRFMDDQLPDYKQVLFCHERSSSDRQTRLVILAAGPNVFGTKNDGPLELEALFIQPGSLTTLPRVLARQRLYFSDPEALSKVITFYAAQPDPQDPSAFHLFYTVDGHPKKALAKLLPGLGRLTLNFE